jgi:hypothetical protein
MLITNYLATRLRMYTNKGAMAIAGSKFPTRIFLISNIILMPTPIKRIPPVAVSSFIIETLMMASSLPASRFILSLIGKYWQS